MSRRYNNESTHYCSFLVIETGGSLQQSLLVKTTANLSASNHVPALPLWATVKL